MEQGPAGSVWHAVGEQGIATRTIAQVIGQHLDIPIVSVAPDAARDHFGWIADIWAINAPTSSTLTQQRLGWRPSGPGLIDDLEQGHYFDDAPRRVR
jgi:hypothetical protein